MRSNVLVMRRRTLRTSFSPSGTLLASPSALDRIAKPQVPYTIIAGTGGYRWLSAPFGNEPNDGVVSVDETRIHDSDEPILLNVAHSFMMNDRRLHAFVVDLLREPD